MFLLPSDSNVQLAIATMSQNLTGEICLVTGASRGIGKAIALALGQQGAVVYGTATSESGANAISEYLSVAGIAGKGLALNVNDEASVQQAVSDASNEQAVSILVNNAGITRDNLLMRMKEDEWDDIMSTNLKSAYRMSKACLRGMTRARHGRIINISSVVGSTGNAGQANYAAAKAGLAGFSRALAQEVASRQITVNTVAPGFIETDMTQALSEDQRSLLLDKVPLARLGTPEDVAAAVLFLASAQGGYITGTTLHVNGGMYMS